MNYRNLQKLYIQLRTTIIKCKQKFNKLEEQYIEEKKMFKHQKKIKKNRII